jgi:heat shock protein HslJ
MRRLLSFALALTVIPAMAPAQTITGKDWQLLAIDGVVLDFDIVATLRIEENGSITGKGPCNSFGSSNNATLPALSLGGLRATRMACDKLKEERAFFDSLAQMTSLAPDGSRNLILTGPDGRSMEFVQDRMNSLTTCKTCPAKE